MEKKHKKQKGEENVELFQVSQKAIIYDQESKKYLLAKYDNEMNYWGFIGGRIDEGENAKESIQREIIEEVGDIDFDLGEVVGADTDLDWKEKNRRCRVGYFVLYRGGEIELSEEHSEYVWKTAEEILSDKQYNEKVKFFIQKTEEYLSKQDALGNWKRAVAEFENYKKSKMNVEKDMAGRAVEDFAYKLLPVLDNFHMSTDHIPEDQKDGAWVQGILHIQKQIEQVLAEMDVVEIEAKEGDTFDPNFHEAVKDSNKKTQVASDKKEPALAKSMAGEEEKVKKVLMRGYKRGERVIRPARVTVSSW